MTAMPPQTPSDDPRGDRAWAGRVVFPRSSAELRSTTVCPACLVPLTSTVCRSCGLDLRHEASADLARASVAAADAVDARLDLIGRIRRDTATTAVGAPAVAATSPVAASVAPAPPVVKAPAEAQPSSEPAATAHGPRRSGIQIALIIVGVSLLSVFAVFALVFAFVTYGTGVRMAIITGGTLLTMIAAGVLKRRGLDATGEGIGVLGTVMLVLIAWALRVDSPVGFDLVPDALYWAIALLVVGAFCALWALTSRLSTPAIVAAALLPIGAGLLTGHLVDQLLPLIVGAATTAGTIATLFVAALSWRIIGSSHPATRSAARVVAQSIGAIAAVIALVSLGTLDDGNRWAPVIGGLVLAAASLLHVVTSGAAVAQPRRAFDTLMFAAIGGGAVFAAMTGAVLSAFRFDQDRVIVSAPVLAAVALAVVAEQVWRRSPVQSGARTTFASATLVAAAFAAVAGGLAAVVGASAFAEAATQSLRTLPIGVADRVASAEPATIAALGALALSLGFIATGWASLGVLVHRARAVTLIGSILVVAIVPLAGPWWLVMLIFVVLAFAGAIGLHRVDPETSRDARRALLALCIPLASGAALGAFLTGWATPRGGIVGLIIALLTIGIARPATPLMPLRAGALALAALLVLGSAPALARDAVVVGVPDVGTEAALLLTAALIIVVTQLGRLSASERHAAGGASLAIAVAVAAVVGIDARPGSAGVDRLDDVVTLMALLVALALVTLRRPGIERSIARATLPLVVVALALAAIAPLQLNASLSATVVIGGLIIVAALGLMQRRDEAGARIDRRLGDIGSGALGIVVLASGLSASPTAEFAWAPVLALAVLALVTAISRDGLIGSRSPRRFIGWVALGLGTTALWIALVDGSVSEPEAYSLPLAGAVLAIAGANAIVTHRKHSQSGTRRVDRTAAPLTAAALVVAVVPSALASVDDSWARYLIVAVSAIVLAIVPLLRAASLDARLPHMTSALVSTGFTALGLLTITHTIDALAAAVPATGAELVRVVVVVALPAAAAVAAWMLATGRLRTAVTAAGIGITAISAALLGLTEVVDPVELVSLPLAVCLLAVGANRLSDRPQARSWPWLGPGVGALLVPSLLAIDSVGEPLWRSIALGVVAAGVFVLALRLKLQAPFVIGGTVLLVHLLVQSWPLLELVGEAVEWWLWLGLAGVIVVALAARYERRLQNARNIAVRISHLR